MSGNQRAEESKSKLTHIDICILTCGETGKKGDMGMGKYQVPFILSFCPFHFPQPSPIRPTYIHIHT